jgi:hypothetical protein
VIIPKSHRKQLSCIFLKKEKLTWKIKAVSSPVKHCAKKIAHALQKNTTSIMYQGTIQKVI